jgi:predicted permease
MPDWKQAIGEQLKGLRLPPAREAAIAEELEQHLDDHYQELLAGGAEPEQARVQALAGLDQHVLARGLRRLEHYTDPPVVGAARRHLLAGLGQDFRYSLRVLAKNPGFAFVAVLTLALGIAGNTAIFSMTNALFLHPPGMTDAANVVTVRAKYDKMNLPNITISAPDYVDARDSKEIFSSVAAAEPSDLLYEGGEGTQQLRTARVTWQWFQTFGQHAMLGRSFVPEEDQAGADRVVILSHKTWKQLFGGDPDIVGKHVTLSEQQYRVIGIAGPLFDHPMQTQLWIPMAKPAADYGPENRFNEGWFAVARLAPGVSTARAQAWMGVLTQRLIDRAESRKISYPRDSGWGMFIQPITEYLYGSGRTPMLVLLAAVGFVLLICCANVAGLMLAKASGRAKELAVRAALGARRSHLIRQVLVESLLMAGAGTLIGVGLAWFVVRVVPQLTPQFAVTSFVTGTGSNAGVNVQLDTYVLLFSAGLGLLSALLFGLAPAWSIASARSIVFLKESGRSSAGQARQRLRSLLVVGEVGIALVLLVGAALFLQSLARLEQIAPGFDPRGVMTAAVTLSPRTYDKDARIISFYQNLTQRLGAQSGVKSAAVAYGIPFSGFQGGSSFGIKEKPVGPGDPGPHSDLAAVSPDYFRVLGIPLRSGRYFTGEDTANAPRVAIIDETLARQYWPGENPIGQHIRRGEPWATIVGVVAHTNRSELQSDSGKGLAYYPIFQETIPMAHVLVRAQSDPTSMSAAIRQAVHEVDPIEAAAYDLQPMEARVQASLGPRRFAIELLGIFAAIALFMAALGLYGVISYSVAQRTQEIGIRMALGARVTQVLGLVIGQGMKLVGIGVALGLGAAMVVARLLKSQLFQISAFDPLTFTLMALMLVAVTLVASYVPAWRATKVNPIEALHYE